MDKHNVETHKPPVTLSVKAGVFVLCFVATGAIFTLMTEAKIETDEVGHLTYINQDIETGFPEF